MLWLDVSADDILAAETRRSEWEDEEDDDGLEPTASCTRCGNPCRQQFDLRVKKRNGDIGEVLCRQCVRAMRRLEDIEENPLPGASGGAWDSSVSYDLDLDLAIERTHLRHRD